ncbi:MAG: helix-turn-helix domain-containing protein [Nitrospinae bacterium]|nr:helix-turn-helix domain-containing protein [Nitrospinota bacterium]
MWKDLPEHLKVGEERFFTDEVRIASSHSRCRKMGIDPYLEQINDILDGEKTANLIYRYRELISIARGLFRDVHQILPDKSCIFLLTDPDARIIDIFSAPEVIQKCSDKGIVHGSSLSEKSCGTNAVALSLRHRALTIIEGEQHYCRLFHKWFCMAAPIIGSSGNPIACLDFSCCSEACLNEKPPLIMLMADKLTGACQNILTESVDDAVQARMVAATFQVASKEINKTFSPRQLEILLSLADGLTCKEAAAKLKISPNTVESHLEKLRERFDANTTVHLMAILADKGLISHLKGVAK